MPRTLTPEQTTSRPDFLLSRWDLRAELNSVTGRTGHPGSKRGFVHRHHHRQTELRKDAVAVEQVNVQPESQTPAKIEGAESIDSPLMAAAVFSLVANTEFVKKHGTRLLAIALVFGACVTTIQPSTPTPENPPAVVVATNTLLPDLGLTQPIEPSATHTATFAVTLTEAQTDGAGGPVFSADIGEQLRRRLDSNMALPVCNQSGNQAAEGEGWVSPQAAEIEAQGGNVQDLYDILRSKLPYGAAIKLCVSEGWFFYVTSGVDHVPYWNQVRRDKSDGWVWADHPNLIPVDVKGKIGDWRPMRLPGDAFINWQPLIINGAPVAIKVDGNDNPLAYFDPVSGEMESLLPPTPEPATATPTPEPPPTEKPTAAATAKPTEVLPLPTAVPPPEVRPTEIQPTPTPESCWVQSPGGPGDTESCFSDTGERLTHLEGDNITLVQLSLPNPCVTEYLRSDENGRAIDKFNARLQELRDQGLPSNPSFLEYIREPQKGRQLPWTVYVWIPGEGSCRFPAPPPVP